MHDLYADIQKTLYTARINKNLHPDFYDTYQKIEDECENALKILKKYN
jgi:hypothetical protein